MPSEVQERCNAIEECYEFTLSYAAQGLASDQGSESGKQIRKQLGLAVEALRGLEGSCAAVVRQERLMPVERYEAFFAVLARDAQNSIAAIELVLAQPVISSQLIDNLNASIHLRAMLTDLFLVSEIFETQQARASSAVAN
jgi:hypothetical protein